MRWCDEWRLLPERFALHEPTATAVLADAHLGYSGVRRRQGDALPITEIVDELAPFIAAAARHRIDKLIVAGDLFERGYDAEIAVQFLGVLAQLSVELVALVPGNHDRGIPTTGHGLPHYPAGYDLGGWHIIHGDRPATSPRTVMGHWHPATRIRGRKAPCFLARHTQLVLPAFSLDAAGADVRKDIRWRGWTCMAVVNSTFVESGMERTTRQIPTSRRRGRTKRR
jgi:uncharacterized protein